MFLQQLINGLTIGGIYAMIAVGYTMVYGVIQLINFAHGEIYMLGAFFAVSFIAFLHLPFFVAFLLSMACCAICGVLLDVIAYRPLRNSPRLAALITAIGMSIFLQNLAMIIWGSRPKPFPHGSLPEYFEKTAVSFWGVNLSWFHLFIFGITICMMIGLNLIIRKTRWGKAMRAVAQNKTMAALAGINVNRVISYTFALAGAMGGAAGIMVSAYYNSLYPTMGYLAGVKAFAAAVLGGIGSVPGAMLGGVVLGIAEALGAGYLSSLYRDGISYAVMIIVIVLIPAGLFGKVLKETKKSM
ncbi:MAG TPA: branched-chain amino acid ABC transporter permease [Desulfobacteraceae bacterium]|nr:branched-chain amino acid ABC transporter permease [Desulfobacteraceae bacterium]